MALQSIIAIIGVAVMVTSGCSRQADQAAALVRSAQARQEANQHDDALILLDRAIALKPEFADALYARGVSHLQLDRIDDAEEQIRQALRYQPDRADAWWTLATIQRLQKRPDQAIDSLSRTIRLDGTLTDACFDRACLHAEQQRWRDAIDDLNVVIQQNPGHSDARLRRAAILRAQGNLDAALADLGRAIQANPDSAAAWYERSLVYRQQDQPARALADLSVACRITDNNVDFRRERADLLMALERFQEAGEDYDRVAVLKPDTVDPVLCAAAAFERAEKPIRAAACLNSAIRLLPDRADLYRRRARLLRITGDLPASRKDLARAQKLSPENREPGLELMMTHIEDGRPEMALHISDGLVDGAGPDDLLRIRKLRADLYEKVGRPDDAIREYGLLAEFESQRVSALTEKSRLHLQAEQWKPAAEDLSVVLKSLPDNIDLRMLRATAWEKLGRKSDAIEDLTIVLSSQPELSAALQPRAGLLLELDRTPEAMTDLTTLCRLHPNDSDRRLQLADLCLLQRQYDRVFEVVSDVSDDDPNAAALCYLRGAAHFEQQQSAEAHEWLDRTIVLRTNHIDARMLRSILLLTDDQFHAALDDLQVVAANSQPGPQLLQMRGRALLETGDPQQALNDLDAVLQQTPEAPVARRMRCRARFETNAAEGVIEDATIVLANDPSDASIRLMRADAAMSLDNYADAAADYEQLVDGLSSGEEDIDLLWKLCQCRMQTEDQKMVFGSLNGILDRQPNHHEARLERAIRRERIGELELALEDLAELIATRSEDVEPLICRARIQQRMGKANMAIEDLTSAIARRDNDPQLYYRRGLIRHQLKEPAAALADLEEAIRLDDSQADYWYVRGNVLAETGEDLAAIDAFEKAIERDSNHTAAWYNYGNMQFAREDFDDAIRCWNEAIRNQPDLFRAYHNRAVALTRLDRPAEAADDYENAIALNPMFAQAYESLAWLLATTDDEELRDPEGAIALAAEACELTDNENWTCLSTLAACHAETLDFVAARAAAEKAIAVAPAEQRQRLAQLTQIYGQRAAAPPPNRL